MRCGAEGCESQRQPGEGFVGHARARRNVRSAFTVARGKGETAGEVERCAQLIPSNDVIDPRWRSIGEHAVSAEGQFVIAEERELLLAQIVIPAVIDSPV